MQEIVLFAVLGFGAGSLIAVNGLALVLFYQGSGTVNLATGAMAAFGGFVFYGLRNGYLFSPFPFGSPRFDVGGPLATLPALVIALVVCALGGVVVDLVFRRLRHTSPLARIIAGLGILLLLNSIIQVRFGAGSVEAPAVLPRSATIDVFSTPVLADRFILLGIAAALTVALHVTYRYTRFGLATRAAAEDEAAAVNAGLDPHRLSMINSVAATTVICLFGILVAPMTQLDVNAITLSVIPALGAALLARFTSFITVAVLGVSMGMIQSVFTYLQTQDWFPVSGGVPLPGVPEVIFFLVIVGALIWRGNPLPTRSTMVERGLPPAPAQQNLLRLAAPALTVAALAVIFLPFALRQALIFTLIGAIACLALVVITGFVGQVALSQLALAGLAGLLTAKLAGDLGLPFPIGPLAAVALATVVGVLLGAAALRIRGVNLAILTLAGAVAIEQFGFANVGWTGGTSPSVPEASLFGVELGPRAAFFGWNGQLPSPTFGLVCVGAAGAIGLFVCGLRRSTIGQQMLAVRSNERAAAAAGIDVTMVKLVAFALSSAVASIAGILYAYNFAAVDLHRFGLLSALGIVALAYLGGITTVSGAVIGGLLAPAGLVSYLASTYLHLSVDYQLFIYGLSVVIAMIATPEGAALHLRTLTGRVGALMPTTRRVVAP